MFKFRLEFLVVLVLVGLAGCGSSKSRAKVSGTVTYRDQPVKAGNVTFHSEDKGSYNTTLSEQGTYEIADVPPGDMIVTIETASMNPDMKVPTYGGDRVAKVTEDRMAAERKGGFGPPPKEVLAARYVKIPDKYAGTNTTDLKIKVTGGSQTQDFPLKD